MTNAEFLCALEEALEIEPKGLSAEAALANVQAWDSMSALIFMSLADERLGASLTGDQLANCTTVQDLLDLLGDHLTG